VWDRHLFPTAVALGNHLLGGISWGFHGDFIGISMGISWKTMKKKWIF
jgi:hypothetical protein